MYIGQKQVYTPVYTPVFVPPEMLKNLSPEARLKST